MTANGAGLLELALARVSAGGAASADAVLVESDVLEARVRGREIDFVKQAREQTLGVRSFVEGSKGLRCAITSSSDLRAETVARIAEECVALARAVAPDPGAGLPEGGFAREIPDLTLFAPGEHPFSVDERIQCARQAEAAARAVDARITNSEGSQVGSDFSRIVYATSSGFVGEYQTAGHTLFSEPIASQNGDMQRDYWLTVGRSLSSLEDPAQVGRRAAERALRRLGARRIPTCEVPVIFDPLTAPSLLGHLVQCVNGYAVYRGASFLAGRLDEVIASEQVTVIDDGRLPGGLGSKPFDGEGQATRRNVVIERGRLASYLLDSYSARKLELKTTGNAGRSAASAPSATPTNLWLEPGSLSLEDIIGRTSRGLLVTELIGMGFNPVTGDYSQGAVGFWIEAGEILHPVHEVTIAGHLGDMLSSIDAIGNDLLWLGRVAAPSLRVARMTVAGS